MMAFARPKQTVISSSKPPKDLKSLLGLADDQTLADIYFLGLQEIVDNDAWHTKILEEYRAKDYVRVKTRSMLALTTQVYVKRKHITACTNVESEMTKTGYGGVLGNKGGVSVRLDFYGVNIIFVNSHFTAFMERYADRIEDFNDIISTQKFRDDSVDVILDHDYVFWTGDLNFRINDLDKAEIERRIQRRDFSSIEEHDQLTKGMREKLIFMDFEEGPLQFAPTYKFNKGTDDYDTSKKARKPAWCDRILWMVHEDSFKGLELGAKLVKYDSLPQYKVSDHKPVFAEMDIEVIKDCPPMPIYFFRVQNVQRNQDVKFSYKLDAKLDTSSWDYIALYRKNFAHIEEHKTWVYAKEVKIGDKVDLEIDDDDIKESGEYMLGYFSKQKNCLVGYSNVFSVSGAIAELVVGAGGRK